MDGTVLHQHAVPVMRPQAKAALRRRLVAEARRVADRDERRPPLVLAP